MQCNSSNAYRSVVPQYNSSFCSFPGPAPGWFLEYVEVKDELLDKIFRFPCDRWLAKNDDDGQIMRELACANNDYLDLNEKTSKAGTVG